METSLPISAPLPIKAVGWIPFSEWIFFSLAKISKIFKKAIWGCSTKMAVRFSTGVPFGAKRIPALEDERFFKYSFWLTNERSLNVASSNGATFNDLSFVNQNEYLKNL